MVTSNQTYFGEHFEMYRNIKSQCCVPGNNIILQVNYTLHTQENALRKRDQIWGYQRCQGEEKELDKNNQKDKLPVTR